MIAIIAGKKDTIPQPPPMLVRTGATIDRFVLWISATDPNWDARRAEAFVRSLGADGVRLMAECARETGTFARGVKTIVARLDIPVSAQIPRPWLGYRRLAVCVCLTLQACSPDGFGQPTSAAADPK